MIVGGGGGGGGGGNSAPVTEADLLAKAGRAKAAQATDVINKQANTEGEKGADGDVTMGGTEGVGVAQGTSGEEVMDSGEFWDDLRGWLMQRVRDEGKVEEVWSLFKRGWDER